MATCVLLNVASTCTIPTGTMRFSFFLKTFFLPAFAAAFAMNPHSRIGSIQTWLSLRHGLFLIGHRALARSLARTRIGVRALATSRKTAPMAHAAVGSDLNQPPDVQRGLFAQIAFHCSLFFQDRADFAGLFFRQVLDLRCRIDPRAHENGKGPGPADAVYVCQSYFRAFLGR